MAKLYREDIVIWTPPGGNKYYLLEREAFEKEKVKKSIHRFGQAGVDAVFPRRELAEAELLKFPSRAEEEAARAAAAAPAEA